MDPRLTHVEHEVGWEDAVTVEVRHNFALLPGPGRFLSSVVVGPGGRPDDVAPRIIDGDPQTGWSINGGQGKPHAVVFTLAEPLENAGELAVQIICERYYAAALGRFRISTTDAAGPLAASSLPAEVDELLLVPAAERTAARSRLAARPSGPTPPQGRRSRTSARRFSLSLPPPIR